MKNIIDMVLFVCEANSRKPGQVLTSVVTSILDIDGVRIGQILHATFGDKIDLAWASGIILGRRGRSDEFYSLGL